MMLKSPKITTLVLSCCLANQAVAGNCTAMLNDMMNWSKQEVIGKYFYISTTISSNISNRASVTYSASQGLNGALRYIPGSLLSAEKLNGNLLKTYYSNRTYSFTDPGCNPNAGQFGCIPSTEPFNPLKTENTRITLTKNTDPTKANVSLVFGNRAVNFTAQCDNGHIYGFKSDRVFTSASPFPVSRLVHTLYDLTFSKSQMDVPH